MSLALCVRIARSQRHLKPTLPISASKHIRHIQKKNQFHANSISYKKRQDDVYNRVRSSHISKNTSHKPSFSFPEEYPQLFALPIMRKPLFPGFYKSIFIRDPFVVSVIKGLIKRGQPYVGVFLIKKEEVDIDIITSMEQVYQTGVFAQITNIFSTTQNDETGYSVTLYPHRRIKIKELVLTSDVQFMGKLDDKIKSRNEKPPPTLIKKSLSSFNLNKNDLFEEHMISIANVENIIESPVHKSDPMIQAIASEISTGFKEIARSNPALRDQITSFSTVAKVFNEPSKLPDYIASISLGEEPHELQQILNTTSIEKRLQLSLEILKKELGHIRLREQISKDADSQITKKQRETYLLSELEKIKKELGLESDVKEKWTNTFNKRVKKLTMSESAKKVYQEELLKFSQLQPSMTEFNLTRDYLDWITQVPWGKRSIENYNIKRARSILDDDHYGLKDVKDQILEFIAVSKLRGSIQGKILCLCGPPGVGKTSIGKSVARALDRPFFRFSVGGLEDVAEIKGHRRTYVGSMPGKIIHALKKVQAENPLILIDEVDKMGKGIQGSATSSALLELLDPEQNHHFLDYYLDIPVDLSKVLFICTANTLDMIPAPLLDRMEIIQLSGYSVEEKENIALKHLIPASKRDAGLHHVNVSLTNDAVCNIINGYCRENGVRSLKKQIDKIFRKVAFQIVQEHSHFHTRSINNHQQDKPLLNCASPTFKLDTNQIKEYLGPIEYHSNQLYEKDFPLGVVMGQEMTDTGSSLYFESILKSHPQNNVTLRLSHTRYSGGLMKEPTITDPPVDILGYKKK